MEGSFFKGKAVLVTGGTGTFGHAFVRKMLATSVKKVIVFSRDEFKQSQMRHDFPDERLRFFIGDIRERDRLERAFQDVDVVVHAAALKQVPATEYNPTEAIKTNINGTQNVIDAALDAGVAKVLTISSDKAVHPINLYGATKLSAEKLTVAANVYRRSKEDKPRLSVMRYGNILGSRGSFLELVEQQRKNGVVTLTDERMTRFWVQIDYIMDLVLQTLEDMQGGEIFVPKMESLRVVDVIKHVAPECHVEQIGIRPGEKLHEILITEHEAPRTLDIGAMYMITPEHVQFEKGKRLKGMPVAKGFTYASGERPFLKDFKDAPRILGGRTTSTTVTSRANRSRPRSGARR